MEDETEGRSAESEGQRRLRESPLSAILANYRKAAIKNVDKFMCESFYKETLPHHYPKAEDPTPPLT